MSGPCRWSSRPGTGTRIPARSWPDRRRLPRSGGPRSMAFSRYWVAAGRSKEAIFTRPMLKRAMGESGAWAKAWAASVWAALLAVLHQVDLGQQGPGQGQGRGLAGYGRLQPGPGLLHPARHEGEITGHGGQERRGFALAAWRPDELHKPRPRPPVRSGPGPGPRWSGRRAGAPAGNASRPHPAWCSCRLTHPSKVRAREFSGSWLQDRFGLLPGFSRRPWS